MKKTITLNFGILPKLLSSFILSLFFLNVYATNYYVATTGSNNNNNGTSPNTPWRNVNYAASRAGAGDVVNIASGTYIEQVKITNSGTPGQYIKFVGVGSTKPIITGAGLCIDFTINNQYDKAVISAIGKSYIILENLEVQYSPYIGIAFIGPNATDITIRNCKTYRTLGSGIYCMGYGTNYNGLTKLEIVDCEVAESHYLSGNFYEEAISVVGQASNISIHGNYVHDIGLGNDRGGPLGIDLKVGVKDAIIFDNLVENVKNASGIYSDGYDFTNDNINIYNNTIRNCKDFGITFGAEQGGKTINSSAYNNLIYGCEYGGIVVAGQGTNTIANINIYNNTVYKNRAGSINVTGSTGLVVVKNNILAENEFSNGVFVETSNKSNIVMDNNIVWSNRGRNWNDPPLEELSGTNAINADPLFAWAGNNNFRLKPGSPAIDAATKSLVAQNDLDGNRRPLGNTEDIGAYEFVPSTTQRASQESIVESKIDHITIYPNPATQVITIKSTQPVIGTVELIDSFGKKLERHQYKTKIATLDISKLAVGMYTIKINNTTVRKIIKE
jgi:hypothetical protein